MRRIVVLWASAALAVLVVGVAALFWPEQAQAQEPCSEVFCLDKTATPSTVTVGEPITFTVTERCPGGACGIGFDLVDQLPSGLNIDSVDADAPFQPDYQCTTSGNTVTCPGVRQSRDDLPFVLTIVATPTQCGSFTNTATNTFFTVEASFTVSCVPTTKEQCKNNGWKNFENPDGSPMFKNQGDCVSYVATHGKNEPGQNVPNTM